MNKTSWVVLGLILFAVWSIVMLQVGIDHGRTLEAAEKNWEYEQALAQLSILHEKCGGLP